MRIVFFAAGLFLTINSCAQPESKDGYRLDFNIKGLQDTTIYLGYYYGESTYLRDTAVVDGQGIFRFENDNKLPEGVYFLVLDKTRLFDIVIGDNQWFSMETSSSDYIRYMKIKGSEDNSLFFENMLFNAERHQEADPLVAVLKDSLATQEEKKEARVALSKVDKKVLEHQRKIVTNAPKTLTARWLNAAQPVVLPDSLAGERGAEKPSAQYQYYRDHFFDNLDLSDDALIRLPDPLYADKLIEYLDKVVAPNPDSLVKAIKKLAEKAKKTQETYKYLVWNTLMHYQQPKFMGLDRVYVALYDHYFASGEMDFWVGDGVKKNLKEHADRLRLSLIGNKANNLIMQDQNLVLQSMYDIKNKYTLIFFFDPDCGHCKVETPKLLDFYNENKERFDLAVYAVSTDTSMQKMKDYIKEMKMPWITVNGPRTTVGSYNKLYDVPSTPAIYIVDRQKKIIAKKPPIEILADFFENYEMVEKKSKNWTMMAPLD